MMLAALAGYVLLQLAIAYWASRKIAGDADYLVAGRRLGLFAVGISVFATWFGGETVIGSTATIATEGIAGARAEPIGYALCLILAALLVAGQLRARGYMTLADFFRDRFGPRAEVAAALVAIPTSVVWAAAQLLALASIIAVVAGLPVQLTLVGAAGLVIVYTLLGGLLGDVITDIVQSVVVLTGLVLLLVLLFMRAGGIGEGLAMIQPEQLVLVPEGESWIARLDAFAIPILGSIVAQEMIARFLGARTARIAVRGGLIAGAAYLVVGFIPLTFGLIAPHLGFDPAEGDLFLPNLARDLLPGALFVVFVGSLFSAVLSTVDSALLAVSALSTENIYARLRPEADEREKLVAARVLTVAAGLCAYAVATSGETIYGLVEIASSLGSAGLLVSLLVGLRTRFGGEASALAALAGGLATIAVAEYVFAVPGAFMLSILMAGLAYALAGLVLVRPVRA
ncbi:sodium:solute symporter [Marinicauda algicola]|uniref:Sodium:solute symporter n=1 Tax=Marinicauda algicola TaxID=2029849 RepID=A0A4S2H2X5_9PROT|nr:sodium:solute symporter [Marinicauda algicola]TGY89945.1 sodium:solute symporter [Marinicauda algicola]